jgi:uncharacterized protein YbaP (TraB family)
MRKITAAFVCLLTFANIVGMAQTKPKPKPIGNKSLLWVVSGKGLAKPSYLFGTIHLICSQDYLWTTKMKKSLAAADKVCFEMDLDNHETMLAAANGFMDTSGKQLKDYFSPADYKLLKKFVKDSVGFELSLLQQMKPVALESIISMKVTDCASPISYEDSIMRSAKSKHKEILGLEDPSEQIDVLASVPTDSVIKEVLEDIQNFSKSKQDYREMVQAYRKQDLPELYRIITTSASLGDQLDAFLDDRNKKWIARMEPKMAKSSVFFAVGAGHLLGDNGVIALLRKAGYSVEPLK